MKTCARCGYTTLDLAHTYCPRDGTTLDEKGQPDDPWLGRTLEGRYKIMRLLGRGGMSSVYSGENLRIGQRVAVKIVGVLAHDLPMIRRLEREARTVALLGHENIVTVLDFGVMEEGGGAFLVMEHLEGETLAERLRRAGPMPLSTVCHLLIQAADALEMAHDHGVVHRDIKPDNVFVCHERGRQDVIKLLDFGLAALHKPGDDDSWGLDSPQHVILGTPGYLAPEQTRGGEVGTAADIFGLAVTMYEMLSGESPFAADDPVAAVLKVREMEPVPLSRAAPDLPLSTELDALMREALKKHPDARLPSMRAFRSALVELRRKMGEPANRRVERFEAPRVDRQPVVGWVSTTGGMTVVELAGAINERADLKRISVRVVGPEVVLRLSRISRINSVGQLHWSAFLRGLVRGGYDIRIHELSPAMVRQLSTIEGFCLGLPVESFYAPLYCRRCDAERSVLLETADARTNGMGSHLCASCGHAMDLDEVEQSYFAFLQQRDPRRDRREHFRFPLVAPVDCYEADGEMRRLYVTNLSLGGAFVLSMRPPTSGTQLTLTIRLDDGVVLTPLPAEVVYRRWDPQQSRGNGFGVQFGQLDTPVFKALSAVVDGWKPQDARGGAARSGRERRADVRVRVNMSASLQAGEGTFQATVVDMSMSGALLAMLEEADLREAVPVALSFKPPASAERVDVRGKVVRVLEGHDRACVAVLFVDVSPAARAELEQLLVTVLSGSLRPGGDQLRDVPTLELPAEP